MTAVLLMFFALFVANLCADFSLGKMFPHLDFTGRLLTIGGFWVCFSALSLAFEIGRP